MQRTERLSEAAAHSLALCPGILYDCGWWEDHVGQPCPAGFPGDSHPGGGGVGWPQRDGFAHGQPNLLSENRALSFSAL